MYLNKLTSLVVLLAAVEISIAKTLYRRFDINEFLTPSDDGGAEKANQANTANESDFEYDGFHGIGKQMKDATSAVTNHYMTATANSGVVAGGVLANIAYQLLHYTKKGISFIEDKTVGGLEHLQNKHKSVLTFTRDAIANSGNYIADKLEKVSGVLDDVAKMSGEEIVPEMRSVPEEVQSVLQPGPVVKPKKKKKKKASSDGKKKSGKNGGKKKKKRNKKVDENVTMDQVIIS